MTIPMPVTHFADPAPARSLERAVREAIGF